MIKYLIVDDEYMAHEIIKGYCDLLPNMELVRNCYDALEAFAYLSGNEVDLIFLDLNMPKLKGFDFLKTLSSPPKVIVTTAYKEYALEGYELNITDYLLKPFGFERFLKAVNKAFGSPMIPSVTASENRHLRQRIFLKSDRKYIQVVVGEIRYVEASGNYTKVVNGSETIVVREKISDLLELLPKQDFMQVHKSFAVAVKHIQNIEGNRIFIEENVIPIGKVYKNNVLRLVR